MTGHVPVLMAESLAQLCGLIAFAGVSPGAKPARLAQVDVKIHAAIRPPAEIELWGTMVREIGNLLLFDVVAKIHGSAAAGGRIVLSRTP